MVAKIQLRQLVDLAINISDPGAVNFAHLRTLLIEVLKLTNCENSLVEEQNESFNLVKGVSNVTHGKGEEIISHSKDNNKSRVQFENKNKDNNFIEKIAWLEESQKDTLSQVSQLNKLLQSFEDFPKNKNILFQNDENGVSEGDETLSQLGLIYQNKKVKKRLEANEEAIDKLFSLMNDVLSDYKRLTDTYENTTNVDNNHNHNSNKDRSEELSTISTKIKDFESKLTENANALGRLNSDVLNLKEVSQNNSVRNDADFHKISNQKLELTTLRSDLAKCQERLNQESKITGLESISKQIEKLQGQIKDLELKLLSYDNILTSGLKPESIHVVNNCNAPLGGAAKSSDISPPFLNLIQQNKDIIEELQQKTFQNASTISDIRSALDSRLAALESDMKKNRETLSNMDNAELKTIMNNFDQLQNMANEIDELRKLADLKDLADNVQNFQQFKDDLIKLQNTVQESTKHTSTIENHLNSLHEQFEHFKQHMNDNSELNNNDNDIRTPPTKENLDLLNLIRNLQSEHKQLKEDQISMRNAQNDLRSNIESKEQQQVLDTSVLAAIQHLAQQNRQQISTCQAEVNLLRKMRPNQVVQQAQPKQQQPKKQKQKQDDKLDELLNSTEVLENLKSLVDLLQEEQLRLSGHLANTIDDTKDEFRRKQNHIDALYEYIDKLQHNKADKDDINSEMDVKADKIALDGKVNMSTFDERYQLLEQALQHALDKLDQYVNQETHLKESLEKLNEDLNSKMDSDAEKKLKKFLEHRLKEIQHSRTNLPDQDQLHCDMRNAAGLRKPAPMSYHCISCDRPIDVTMRGVMPPVPQNFPSKKTMGPYTSFEMDQMRQTRKAPQASYETVMVNRPCGGQHTTVNASLNRIKKLTDGAEIIEKLLNVDDSDVIDCVVGKDGQLYRGRFKPNEAPPLLPKKIPNQNLRNKFHNRHKYVHSATPITHNNCVDSRENLRSQSAGLFEQMGTNKVMSEESRRHSPKNTSPISLPPINREGSLVISDGLNGVSPKSQLEFQSI